ncbi:MAG: MFS transporter [Clostridia bacterium]|nr:MFS transporter [Clostridia bacterium]
MKKQNFKLTKLSCYTAYFTMSSIFSLPPLLFATLQDMYGISYTLLGTLVLTNFCTQLTVDLIFTVFTKYFNVKKVVRIMPLITSAGMLIYAVVPKFMPEHAYAGLLIGTILFSVSAGLSEVLLSPVIAAIPSDNPQKDMSLLHSLYAFGVFTVVVISTLFLRFFGAANWFYLTLFWAALPVTAAVMFMLSPMPEMDVTSNSEGTKGTKRRTLALALCVGCIFFGSCAENAMSNWISSYMENALHIDKTVGDILGVAMFAILLGMARIGYAKYGKNIIKTLFIGMSGAVCCYLIAGLSTNIYFAFVACILTGLFTAMLWPGTLIMMEENLPGIGVAAYALMAAGGDFGASLAPQLLGVIVDKVSASNIGAELSQSLNLSTEQIGLKAGMLATAIYPVLGVILLIFAAKYFKKHKSVQE